MDMVDYGYLDLKRRCPNKRSNKIRGSTLGGIYQSYIQFIILIISDFMVEGLCPLPTSLQPALKVCSKNMASTPSDAI